MGKYIDPEERRYQRRLIPLNIVMAVIALVATISLLFAPLLVVDMSKATEGLTESGTTEEGSSNSSDAAMNDLIKECLDFKLSISTMTFGQLGFAPADKQLETFVDSLFPAEVIEHLMVSAVNLGVAMGAEILEEEGFDLDKLTQEFKKIDGVKSKDEFQEVTTEYVDKIVSLTGDVSEETRTEITKMLNEMYDDTVNEVGADNFSLEAFVCVSFVGLVNENLEEGATEIPVVTEYNDLFVGILDGSIALPGSGDTSNAMDSVVQMFESFGMYFKIVFAVLAFFALIWFILFLFAFIRIFTKNKRFTMWYAKLLGGIPCLIFGVAPLIGGLILGASLGAEVTAMLGAITSYTWISGGCYLLMWVFSIFWAFPIKRKIRKIRKGQY